MDNIHAVGFFSGGYIHKMRCSTTSNCVFTYICSILMILLDTFCASRGPKSLGEQLFHPHWLHISPPMRQQHANPCTKVVILTITTTDDDDTQWSPHYQNTTLILIPTDPATSSSKLGLIASSHKSTIYQRLHMNSGNQYRSSSASGRGGNIRKDTTDDDDELDGDNNGGGWCEGLKPEWGPW